MIQVRHLCLFVASMGLAALVMADCGPAAECPAGRHVDCAVGLPPHMLSCACVPDGAEPLDLAAPDGGPEGGP